MSKQYQQHKDFYLEELAISNYTGERCDLRYIRGELYIYEDIFSGPISGSLRVYDSQDLPHLLPIIGEERIHIEFTKPLPVGSQDDEDETPTYKKDFRVYNITDRMPIKENTQTYVIHFISEEFFQNFFQVTQCGFIDKRYSEMVEEVYADLVEKDRPIFIEPTKYHYDFITGNMTPFQLFNCLASRSISDEGNGSAYVFYEDQEKFNFVTVGKLFEAPPVAKFIYQPANLANMETNKGFDTEQEMTNVEIYHHNANINPVENICLGMYGATLWHIDPVRDRFEKQEFKLSEEFKNFKHVDKIEPYRKEFDLLDKVEAHMKFLVSDKERDLQPHLIARDPNIRPERFEECVLQRASQILQLESVRITVKIPGDPTLTAGNIIEFSLPQNAGDVADDRPRELDEYLQGNYLITSLKHSIVEDIYTLTIEIIKDTYHTPIEAQDPKERYIDRY